jgi:Ca-activated chloride channel family protein
MGRLILLIALLQIAPATWAGNSLVNAWRDLWWTPEQQAQQLFERGDFEQAAKHSRDPMRIGIALYRAGEFEAAAAAFERVNSPAGAFNQGTALILRGQYEAAIAAFDRALETRPDWTAAQENRAIAEVRLARKANHETQEATEVGADEIVFDNKKGKHAEPTDDPSQQGSMLSEQELRVLWLKKSQTSPAVFLRAKFAAQLATQESGK